MNQDLLSILACPECGGGLQLRAEAADGPRIERGTFTCTACGRTYPVERSVARFVPPENYASNFGFQWNRFRQTQLDSYSGVPISRDRFYLSTRWTPEELKGKRVLDVGCGAGRFAEVATDAGARVVALDYSTAVDACYANLGRRPNIDVVQGDIYKLPFKPGSFDYVYCLGVLQHTPDVKKAFLSLPPQLNATGKLAVDMYAKLALNALWPKYWLRPLTKRIPGQTLFRLIERAVPLLLPVSRAIGAIPVVGKKLRYAVPIVDYAGVLPLSRRQLKDWAVLDTFDMLGPRYDQPQSAATLESWFREAGLRNISVERIGQMIGRGAR